MQNSTRTTRRQSWITAYRVVSLALLVALVTMSGLLLGRSFMPVTAAQVDKVARAASFLKDVGFNNPVYLGVRPGVEGEYPMFRAEAIGGQPVVLWIRTTPNGGWEIQPDGTFKSVSSADAFARLAQEAVFNWEYIPADIKPRTDGAFGEYESRKYDFDLLAKYNPDDSYWHNARNETSGWPRQ